MTGSLTICSKSIGRRKPLFADFSFPIPPDFDNGAGGVTLRMLITKIVLHEVAAFRDRQADRGVVRALSAAQIDEGAAQGKIDSGGHSLVQRVDEQSALAAALQGFEDGLYLVIIDNEQQHDLDRQIYVKPGSTVTFVRLVFLAGG